MVTMYKGLELTPDQILHNIQFLSSKREAWELKVKQQKQKFDEAEEQMEGMMLAYLDRIGVNGVDVGGKRLTKKPTSRYNVGDRDSFLGFIRNTGNVELLECRAAQLNCQKYQEDNGEAPPGLNIFTRYKLQITKGSAQ